MLEIPALGTGLGALKVASTCGVCRKPLLLWTAGLSLGCEQATDRYLMDYLRSEMIVRRTPVPKNSLLDPLNTGLSRLGARLDINQVILPEEGC